MVIVTASIGVNNSALLHLKVLPTRWRRGRFAYKMAAMPLFWEFTHKMAAWEFCPQNGGVSKGFTHKMAACGYRMNMNMKTVENKAKNNSGELTDKCHYTFAHRGGALSDSAVRLCPSVCLSPACSSRRCILGISDITSPCSATYVRWQRGTARVRPPHAAAVAIDRVLLPTGPTAANLQQCVCCQGRLRHINDGANAPWIKIGGRFLQELRGECVNYSCISALSFCN